jgi:plasmid stability protein
MAQLLVRGSSEEIVRRLRARAVSHGRSVEAEHRAILEAAVLGPHTTADAMAGTRPKFRPHKTLYGKSTMIESLRYALALEPLGEDAREAHDGVVRHLLRSGTRVSLLLSQDSL